MIRRIPPSVGKSWLAAKLCSTTPFVKAKPAQRFTPIGSNPLARWSVDLSSVTQEVKARGQPHRNTPAVVGLEGCRNAFNALNAIRTTLYFGCVEPAHFLHIKSASDINQIQMRPGEQGNGGGGMSDIACFGSHGFDSRLRQCALFPFENFAPGARSIHSTRLQAPCHQGSNQHIRILIGHENDGVASKYIIGEEQQQVPRTVVYIPQFGTISSLNVVTCLGVALFYSFLDAHYAASRSLMSVLDKEGTGTRVSQAVGRYQLYASALPKASAPSGSSNEVATSPPSRDRIDARPIHPMFYNQSEEAIRQAYLEYLNELVTLEMQASDACEAAVPARSRLSGRPLFGVSVFYENDFDQRNFGGLLRNANAFIADHVLYAGRKKFNIVGAVGCHHYSKPLYLGAIPPLIDKDGVASFEACVNDTICSFLPQALTTSTGEVLGGKVLEWWLLSCGHEFLYEAKDPQDVGDEASSRYQSDPQSVAMFYSLLRSPPNEHRVLSLCHTEETLAAMLNKAYVVLVVPQEGKLPHPLIMRRCSRVVTVGVRSEEERPSGDELLHRGLPSQVASGIALERLLAVGHPLLRW